MFRTSIQPFSITKIEENLIARFAYLSQSPWAHLERSQGLLHFHSNISYSHYLSNLVLQARFQTPEQAHAQIQGMIKQGERRQQAIIWAVWPNSYPKDLGHYLQTQGFELILRCPGMIRDLDQLQVGEGVIEGLQIDRVKNNQQLKDFVDVLALNSNLPPDFGDELFKLELSLGFPSPRIRQRYVGYWQGQPVATVTLVMGAGVAGLYHVATLPEARGRGIAAHLSQQALRDARRLGYRYAVLMATPAGERVYQRLGFQSVIETDIYEWQA